MRVLGLAMAAVFLTACATTTSSPPPPLASVEARIAFLESQGISVQREKVIERGHDLHFPLGECGAVLHFFDQRAQLDLFKDESWALEELYGDDIRYAGKTAKTQVCKVGERQPTQSNQPPQ